MAKYLVRVEAVNFDNFINDTQDISTIRGGGLLVLDAAKELAARAEMRGIYTGASTGLFVAELPENEQIESYCEWCAGIYKRTSARKLLLW